MGVVTHGIQVPIPSRYDYAVFKNKKNKNLNNKLRLKLINKVVSKPVKQAIALYYVYHVLNYVFSLSLIRVVLLTFKLYSKFQIHNNH